MLEDVFGSRVLSHWHEDKLVLIWLVVVDREEAAVWVRALVARLHKILFQASLGGPRSVRKLRFESL